MGDDISNSSKAVTPAHPNPWKQMTTFERVFLSLFLAALVAFVVLVSVFWSWKAVGLIFLAIVLSRVPFLMLLQLAFIAFLILALGWMLASTM
jgi:hypothetical protein